ncbi:IclR family transcriptional regulator [Streptomyces sp. NPDC055681]
MNSALSKNAGSTLQRTTLPPSMVERITLIMDLFERPHALLTLEDVSYRTGLPRSTAHRILDQLVRMCWLDHTSAGYRLGTRALGLGGRETGHGVLRAAAAPVLHELALRTGLVVHLGVLDEAEVYYLDKIGGRSAVTVPSRVGGRAPAHCTALGKAMLACLVPERIDEAYTGALARRTSRTIGTLDLLHQELSRIRGRHGLAFERGEFFDGVGCVAVALSGPDGPIGALSLVGEVRTPLERLAPVVANAARVIADELCAVPKTPRGAVQSVSAPGHSWSAESMARILASGQGEGWW